MSANNGQLDRKPHSMNVYQLGLLIRVNIRYHDRRVAFLQAALRLEKLIIVMSITATWVTMKNLSPTAWSYFFAALATFLTVFLLVINADEAQQEHKELCKRWKEARKEYEHAGGETSDENSMTAIRTLVTEIEIDELPVSISRLRVATNEVLRQVGSEEVYKQSWFSRNFAQIIDLDKGSNPVYSRLT